MPRRLTFRQQLKALETAELVQVAQRHPELAYLFRHGLIQEAAYNSLLKQQRRTLHQTIGEVLEQLSPQPTGALVPVLAHHFAAAGDVARAWHYYVQAGDHASAHYANAEAAEHYAQALALWHQHPQLVNNASAAQRQHLCVRYGRTLELLNRYPEAIAHYAAMVELAETRADPALRLTALIKQIIARALPTGVIEDALAQTQVADAKALAQALGDPVAEAQVFWGQLLLCRSANKIPEAIACGEQALALARGISPPEPLAFILGDLATCYHFARQPAQARAAAQEAQALWRQLGNWPMLADTLTRMASAATHSGDYAQALALTREAEQLSLLTANTWGQAFSLIGAGQAWLGLGEIAQALATALAAFHLGLRERLNFVLTWACPALVETYLAIGGVTAAAEVVQQLGVYTDKNPAYRIVTYVLLGQVQLAQGQWQAAQDSLKAVEAAPRLAEPFATVYWARLAIPLALAQADYGAALAAQEVLWQKLTTRLISVPWEVEAYFYRAQALYGLGQLPTAYTALAAARQILTTAPHPLWSLRCLLLEHEWARAAGDVAQAQGLAAQAQTLIQFLAERCPGEIRPLFLAQPALRAVLA